MTAQDDRVYLEHILECTRLIQDYTRNGKAEFMASSLVRDCKQWRNPPSGSLRHQKHKLLMSIGERCQGFGMC